MDSRIKEAYDQLVPIDQLVVDGVIMALFQKDKQITDMGREVMRMLEDEKKKND